MKYYHDDTCSTGGPRYVKITDESPKHFKGELFLVDIRYESGEEEETVWGLAQIKQYPTLPGVTEVAEEFWVQTFEPQQIIRDPVPDVREITLSHGPFVDFLVQPYSWLVVVILMLLIIGFVGLL